MTQPTLPTIQLDREQKRCLIIEPDKRESSAVSITGKALTLLEALADASPGQIGKNAIFHKLYNRRAAKDKDLHRVEAQISILRKKIGKSLVRSEGGGKYRLVATLVAKPSEKEPPAESVPPGETRCVCQMCDMEPAVGGSIHCERCTRIAANARAEAEEARGAASAEPETPKVEAEELTVVPGTLHGQVIVLTGALSRPRAEMKKLIVEAGGGHFASLSKRTTLVVAGRNAGSKKVAAEARGVHVIDEDELVKVVTGKATLLDLAHDAMDKPAEITEHQIVPKQPAGDEDRGDLLKRIEQLEETNEDLEQRFNRLEYPIVYAAQGLRGLRKILDGLSELSAWSESFDELPTEEHEEEGDA